MILIVVQPENHRGVFRQLDQEPTVVAHSHIAEQFNLFQELVVVIHLGIAGGKHMMPEERYLLFQGAFGVDQIEHPVDVSHRGLPTGKQCRWLVPHQ
jgi:hypothetical protein